MSAAGNLLTTQRRAATGRRAWLAPAVLALAVLGLGLAQTGPGRSVLETLNLIKPREPFTELYFTQPRALAAVTQGVTPGRVAHVSFVINNSEGHSLTYSWTIAAGARTRAIGTVTLRSGASADITRTLYRVCPRALSTRPVDIRVTLSHPAQSISFWEACRG